MKNSLLIVFFAAFLGFAFSTETGTFAMDVPSASAEDSKSKDDDKKVTICHRADQKDSESKEDDKSKDSKSKEDDKSKDSKSKEDDKSKDSKSKEDDKSKDSKSKEDDKSKDSKSKEDDKSKDSKSKDGCSQGVEWVTISVSTSALDAHLAHGDTVGACYFCPPGVCSCVDPGGNPGKPGPDPANVSPLKSQRNLHGK